MQLFYVVRVNKDHSRVYAAGSFPAALGLANPDPGAALHYFTIVCADAGEARRARKPWRSLYRRFDAADARSLEQLALSIWSAIYRERGTFAEGLERIKAEIYGSPTFYRLPAFAQNRIKGVSNGAYQFISHNLVEWRVMLDGKLTRGEDVPSGRWPSVKPDDGQFVYKDKPESIF